MITMILLLMLTALICQVFCFTRLNQMDAPSIIVPARVTREAKPAEPRKTSLGRPIRIIHVKA